MGHVNMPHSYGVRARTRHMFSKKHRQHGPIHLSQYLMSLKVGDYVDIFADSAIHRGMPHKHYHGRTGIIFNVTKAAVGIRSTNSSMDASLRSVFMYVWSTS